MGYALHILKISPPRVFAAVFGVLVIGCDKEPEVESSSTGIERLSHSEQVIRVSMALRGIRPSLEELEMARNATDFNKAYESLVDTYLASNEFGETIKDLHAQVYLLRNDTELQLPVMGILAEHSYNQSKVYTSTVEAPLNFVKDIIVSDRPYTEILTAQYTLADPVVADIYGLPYDSAGPEWQQTAWVDGRPLAGILSDSQVWRRHTSNASNYNRARANFISNTFLCENIGGRDVAPTEGIDLSNPETVASALQTNDGCVSCHSVLDPLASFFWGFQNSLGAVGVERAYGLNCEGTAFPGDPLRGSYEYAHWCYPVTYYNAEDANLWSRIDLPPPGYFGRPGENMADLGELIAGDPRFAQCTARTFFGYLTQTERDAVPYDIVNRFYEVLEENNFSIKRLVKDIVMSDVFRGLRSTSTADDAPFVAGLQTIRPEQYDRTIEDLTGFRWLSDLDPSSCANGMNTCWGSQDLSDSDLYGYRSMSGGVDSLTVTHPTHTATPTKALTMAKHADEAAGYVVLADFSLPASERHLLSLVEPDTTDAAQVRAQLAWLHNRILGEFVTPESPEVDASFALWAEALERSPDSPADAWQTLISALLQDVRMVYY